MNISNILNLSFSQIFIFFLTVFVTFLYLRYRRFITYWPEHGLNKYVNVSFLGFQLSTVFKTMFQNDLDNIEKYGKTFGSFDQRGPKLYTINPKIIKAVWVKDFSSFRNRTLFDVDTGHLNHSVLLTRDEKWKQQRSIVSPTFSTGKIRKMYPLMNFCADQLLEHIAKNEKSGSAEVILQRIAGCYSLDVIAKCCFATGLNSHEEKNNPFVENAKKLLEAPALAILAIFAFPGWLIKLLSIEIVDKQADEYMASVTRHLINKRKVDGKGTDFLQLLIDTSEESKNFTEEEIIGHSILFFAAGEGTTKFLITYCLYLLAMNPEVQDKLYSELKDVQLDYDILMKLTYLDAVIYETLRYYSPFQLNEREASEKYVIEDEGITLEKGVIVAVPIYAIHHNEEYFPNPEKFDPDRFLPENKDKIDPYTFAAFGVGPRNCIGMRFALVEAKLCIARLVKSYEIVKNTNTQIPLKFKKIVDTLISSDISMTLQNRNCFTSL